MIEIVKHDISAVIIPAKSQQLNAFDFRDVKQLVNLPVVFCWGSDKSILYGEKFAERICVECESCSL